MRLFIGTLYTIENEFDECVAAINNQSYRNFKHFIFKGLPNKEAHDTLYRTFMDQADEFDLLIKVDADMVIENKNLFSKIIEKFQNNPSMQDLEIAVYDFFSEQLIWGMHAYRNNVRWQQSEENLFVDHCPVPDQRVYDNNELAPAAIHCKNPSPFQAFHFGVHNALKIIQSGRQEKQKSYILHHWNILERMYNHFNRTGDKRVGLAIIGSELTFRGGIYPEHYSYTNPMLKEKFQLYASADLDKIRREIYHIKRRNFGLLPGKLRRKMIVVYDSIKDRLS